jgi:hypothetical protein
MLQQAEFLKKGFFASLKYSLSRIFSFFKSDSSGRSLLLGDIY